MTYGFRVHSSGPTHPTGHVWGEKTGQGEEQSSPPGKQQRLLKNMGGNKSRGFSILPQKKWVKRSYLEVESRRPSGLSGQTDSMSDKSLKCVCVCEFSDQMQGWEGAKRHFILSFYFETHDYFKANTKRGSDDFPVL